MFHRGVRALAYLLTSLVLGPATFVWAVVTTLVSGVLSFTYLAPPTFLTVTWVTRWIARLERLRAALVLGKAIEAPYPPLPAGNPWVRGRALVREPATWRDLAWLLLLFPLGLAGALSGVVVAVVDLATIVAPVWLWSVPNPYLPPIVDWLFNTTGGRFVLTALGLALAPTAWWLVTGVAGVQARVAAALLEPGPRLRLARRARELASTRRRVVDAQAAELRRIERDLHDGAQARIVAAGMTLALADRKMRLSGQPARDDVSTARRQLDEALAELRRLVRGIHPPILTDRGLAAALAALAGDAPLPVEIHAGDLGEPAPAVESAAYFVTAEALANAVKHAAATTCTITLTREADVLTVEIHDDGRGGADASGSGLDGLRRRVEALDGTITVTSPVGGPTIVHTELPCAL
ncbi:sensor histidine kinase [Amycolatopsis sp.]|uniref:sensor histidine kinase n=1 Tax=Amycolatopsis sp. TaxID=37632 RepID=UPI002E094765|nr:sensor domain-containing protein [Amycolatopsis sp.]